MSIDCRKDAPIGVFDSGVGGLTVVKEIMQDLPNENLVYFGDTARVPYGSKSVDTIIRFSKQIVRFLQTKKVKAIVIACNTVSALALDILRQETDIPIIGVVKPGSKVAAEVTECIQNLSSSTSRILKYLRKHARCSFRLWKKDLWTTALRGRR